MSDFVPSGYILIRDALDQVGRDLFKSEWTGDERKARSGLISEDEWLKIKDLPAARGGGEPRRERMSSSAGKPGPHASGDPSDPSYQKEYTARQRYVGARHRLRQWLEAGQLEAAILDLWNGNLHPASTSLWRRSDADRMIDKGRAPIPIPGSRNPGSLLVKRFAELNVRKPLPAAKIQQATELLKQKTVTESLTRRQQADFLRKTFPNYHLAERQLTQIYRSVPAPTGRPRKSGK